MAKPENWLFSSKRKCVKIIKAKGRESSFIDS